MLGQLVSQYSIGFPQPLPDYRDELKAAPCWLLAEHYGYRDSTKALEWYEKALTLLEQDVELRKAAARTYISVSYARYDEKKYAECILLLNRAIELDPTDARAYNDRGAAYDWLKQYEQALKDYNRAIELDSKNIKAAFRAIWARMGKQRSGTETAWHLEKIAEINSKDPFAFVCRSVALGLHGKLIDGLAELEQAISQVEPWAWEPYFWKGMLFAYSWRDQAARNEIEKALEIGLPAMFLTPLYWLDKDRPDFFKQFARQLLEKYGV